MIEIEIIPLVGIQIKNIGEVRLGDTKKSLQLLLGEPSYQSNDRQLFYSDYEFRADLDENERIEFIEFIYGPFPEKTKLSLYNINPFETEASELVKILSGINNGKIDDTEGGFAYLFLNLSVGVWRSVTEEIIQEEISALKAANEYEENKDWIEEDLKKAKHFWTIGIGVKDYYN